MNFFQSEKTSVVFSAVPKLTVSLRLFFFSLLVFKMLTCFFFVFFCRYGEFKFGATSLCVPPSILKVNFLYSELA